ncbi:caspase family protein [Spirosoma sp. BT702]|uniref:Caspase family protein n=1 Tax=Spirosoma profusum TaxID=2771354 RepID=A0A927AWG3_9BACT|nr:caspase family protein [Spirosoma profusum]MBD2705657.1 caspase family protein [Spirosoma profusum]
MNLHYFYKSFLCSACAFFIITVGLAQPEGFAVLVGVQSTNAVCKPGDFFDNRATAGVGKDIDKMRQLLRQAKFKDANVKPLLTNTETTAASILKSLSDMIPKAKAGDLVVFYFSGHGDTLRDTNRDELSKFDGVLIASDRCVIDDELDPIWQKFLPGVRLVMIADACHAESSYKINFLDHRITIEPSPKRQTGTRGRNSLAEKSLQPTVRFKNEILFDQSRRDAFGTCLETALDPAQPYQMIYVSASHEATTTGGASNGSLFTDELYRNARLVDPNQPVRLTYRKLMERIDTCPSTVTYAEVGVLSPQFKNDYFLKIR